MAQRAIGKPQKRVTDKYANLSAVEKSKIRISIKVQFDIWQYDEILRKAQAQHLPVSTYCRRASLMQKMPRE